MKVSVDLNPRQMRQRIEDLEHAVSRACGIIETADARNLHRDGPAGGEPPRMSLQEWRTLYVTLNKAR